VITLASNARRLQLVVEEEGGERRPTAPDATEEYDVQDVLDMMEIEARARSAPSIAPVGIDIEPLDLAGQVHLDARRREVTRYVMGAIAIACTILAASAIKVAGGTDAATATRAPARDEAVAAPAPIPRAAPVSAAPASPPQSASAGLVRFTTPAGWAWLDGEQLSTTEAFVPCGTHQVQIGGEVQHDVLVPCGGEVVVSR
jgi:hypothetical protein